MSRQEVGPIRLPIQWVVGSVPRGIKRSGLEADHSHVTSSEVKNSCIYNPIPAYIGTMGTGYLPALKRPGRGTDHPPPSKRRVIGGTFTFTLPAYLRDILNHVLRGILITYPISKN